MANEKPIPHFGEAAAAYSAYRPEYPPALFERILEALPADRRDLAIDLGAGTGLSALPLCPWFREVIAVEPDPQMAARLAGIPPNLVVRNTTAEECAQASGSVDLVTSGTAFHWMDGPRVLANVAGWLRSEGALAVYSYPFPGAPDAVRKVVRREFELHWDRFRHERLRQKDYSRRTIRASRELGNVQEILISHILYFTPRQLVGFCSSTSYGSAYIRTLENPDAYLRELETAFREASPNDMIPLDFKVELLLARKL